jgi:hypothetical protein
LGEIITVKSLILGALTALISVSAHAQTYTFSNLNLSESVFGPVVTDVYDGTFTFSNGLLTSASATQGSSQMFAMNAGTVSGDTVTFFVSEPGVPRDIDPWSLTLTLAAPLGGYSDVITGASFNIGNGEWPIFSCTSACGSVVDPKPAAAPELDPTQLIAALTLLAGGVLVIKSRAESRSR